KRIYILLFFIFVAVAALIIKLIDIQILNSEEHSYYANRQQTRLEKINAERGMIYDCNNSLLAFSRNDVSFYADLRMLRKKDFDTVASTFSKIFKRDKSIYINLFRNNKRNVCIEKKAPVDKAILLKDFKIPGLFNIDEPSRVYPNNNLASHVLGYTDNDMKGVSGIEKQLENKLKGVEGERLVERNAFGDIITVLEDKTVNAQSGNNIYLTINNDLQKILEEELKNGLKNFNAVSATGIIMNPNTGEVLGLSNVDDYDPNNYWKYDDVIRRNRALTDTYEPGSTFKSISMAALLDKNLVRESESVYCENGRYKFNNVYINDSHSNSTLTVKGVIEQSSNIGMAKLIQRMNGEEFYKYVRAFGFGNPTMIDLPGETKGTLKNPKQWNPLTKAFLSFGYEISVTPIQVAAAYCALVNGGILYQPQLIKKEVTQKGEIIFENSPIKVRQVISEKTSQKMRSLLQGVVNNGTAKTAYTDLINVGGKTGTSQKLVNGNYSKSQYNSSFVGFFPVDKPDYVILILFNSPENGRYGGLVAAPVFKIITERIVKNNPVEKNLETKPAEVEKMYTQNFNDENVVNNEQPSIIYASNSINSNVSTMPDLTRYSLKDALNLLNKFGIKYSVEGSGRITGQSITPGTRFKKGSFCKLICSEVKPKNTVLY
ncbi:MAG: penicillin-binding protein, partial [Syntrophothermus sp.]